MVISWRFQNQGWFSSLDINSVQKRNENRRQGAGKEGVAVLKIIDLVCLSDNKGKTNSDGSVRHRCGIGQRQLSCDTVSLAATSARGDPSA